MQVLKDIQPYVFHEQRWKRITHILKERIINKGRQREYNFNILTNGRQTVVNDRQFGFTGKPITIKIV